MDISSVRHPWKAELTKILSRVKDVAASSSSLDSLCKKKILLDVASRMIREQRRILQENQKDLRLGVKARLSASMLDRLRLTPDRIRQMAAGIRVVAGLEDPIGKIMDAWTRPNGLRISRVRVPIGVILIIYESRPNVTVECASLCLKSGNAVILRGGREAFYSNRVLASIFRAALGKHRLPEDFVTFVSTTDRRAVDFLLQQDKDIHLVIPRGGESLIRKVVELSRIPVIKHYQGICHIYVDKYARLKKAVEIVYNAKMQRPGVCNAMETLLVDKGAAARFLPEIGERLKSAGCEVRADCFARKFLPWAKRAIPSDFGREFLDKILAVKVVENVQDAIRHIRRYGSAHTDAIITENRRVAKLFVNQVDSSSVMVNASTRFSDGFEYGFGAEIGISTDKIHARGPMGLEGLTSYKYVVEGNGQVRS